MRPLAQWSRPLSLLHVRWLLQVARLLLHVLHRLLLLHMWLHLLLDWLLFLQVLLLVQ